MSDAEYELAPYSSWAALPDGVIAGVGTWYGVARGAGAVALRDQLAAAPGRLPGTGVSSAVLDGFSDRGVLRLAGLPAPPSYLDAAAAESAVRSSELVREAVAGAVPRKIRVLGDGGLALAVTEILQEELADGDVPVATGSVTAPPRRDELAVVVADARLRAGLAQLNRRWRESGAPWLLIPAWGAGPVVVGPLFTPSRTGCLDCYRTRRSARSSHPDEYLRLLSGTAAGELRGWHRHMAAGLGAALALGWVLTADQWLTGACFELSLARGPVIRRHEVAPVPGCAVCGDSQLPACESRGSEPHHSVPAAPGPGRPRRRPSLEERLVSSLTGPADIVSDAPAGPANESGRQLTATGVAVDPVHQALIPVGGAGKSADPGMARHIALHEFAERLVLHEPPAGLRHGPARAGDVGCPLSGRVLSAVDLASGGQVDLPAGDFYLHPDECPRSWGADRPTSNGAAAGESYPQALERALLELLERDALMTTWRYRLRWPRLRPGAALRRQVAAVGGTGCAVSLVNLSGLHDVPVVACVLRCESGERPVVTVGSAADRTLARAAVRAAREAASIHLLCLERPAGRQPELTFADFADHAYYYLEPGHRRELDRLDGLDVLGQDRERGQDEEGMAGPGGRPLAGDSAQVADELAARLSARGITVYAADLTPAWLVRSGVHVVVTRSPDLYPLELGWGCPERAAQLARHPSRAALGPLLPPDLSPVPLA